MQVPQIPYNERERLESLYKLNILNTPPEEEYDNLTRLASVICNVPVALVSLIDKEKQWFKSKIGTDLCDTDRNLSICAHAINAPTEIMEIPNTQKDIRFKNNSLLKNPKGPIIFYCGVPLKDKNGNAVGTLCVIDHKENKLSHEQKVSLQALAHQIEKLFELREQNLHLRAVQKNLEEQNELLKNFAGIVSHDMKMPLTSMIVTTDILRAKYADKLDDQGKKYLGYLKQSSFKLSDYISSILTHYETDKLTDEHPQESFYLNHFLEEIIDLFNIEENCEINFPENDIEITCNRIALEQIILNLIGNSLKYNDKDKIVIDFDCYEDAKHYHFTVSDNGMGIEEKKQKEVFNLFSTVASSDRHGNKGNGIGLSTVKKLVTNLGGTISVTSEVGKNTHFHFSVKKDLHKKIA
ncbi:sensor histidine kinase [Mesonia maritima]|uniref:histidine kinase n=1 Tax=Mesonia maritima TaxID=1793873 RepID=A0ABU1K600_9FLAO|nr:GAF domain-containing sensor histidine kinase [Mesonia maritima]MDR6301040.1 signal transduction histidine kinase [Mesonia maritima]